MGNQIVIPASKDWWSSVLNSNNYTVKWQIQSGSLFLKFICTDKLKRDQLLVKAYQNEHISSIPYYNQIKKYFEILSKSDIPMVRFFDIIETPSSVFFIRRKFGQPLSDVISQEPSIYPEEKFWITYQLFVALESIRRINIFHGDLKPSNILYVPSGRVYIVDPAPFKPYALDQNHPHYYYYFFANDDSSGCFLAPERIVGSLSLSNPSMDNMPISDLILSDLFSLGCIIAYMYLNGEPLFTVDTVKKYGKGEYVEELENTLATINDKQIIGLIKGLISLDPKNRRTTFDAFFASGFPSDFRRMHDRFYSKQKYFILNQKPNSELFGYNSISDSVDPKKEFPNILSDYSVLKKKNVSVGTRMIFYNYFAYCSFKVKSISEIRYIIDFIIDFTRDFDDESKLMRVVPLFMKLLDFENLSISRKILFSLIEIFQSMESIPDDLKIVIKDSILHLFRQKFSKEGLPLGKGIPTESDFEFSRNNTMSSSLLKSNNPVNSYMEIIAEFLPYFSYEIFRLQPDCLKDCLVTFDLPKNQLEIFKIFSNSMKQVAKHGSFYYYYNCSMYLYEFFNNDVDFKIEYISLLIEIYSNAKEEEKYLFIDDIIIILPHIIRSICPNSNISFKEFKDIYSRNRSGSITIASVGNDNILGNTISRNKPDLPTEWDGPDCLKWEKYTCLVLQYFICLLENHILEPDFTYIIANLMVSLLNSKSEKVYYLLAILTNYFTPYAKQMPLFIFICERVSVFEGISQANIPDPIRLQEKKKVALTERIKFANPLVTVQLVQKYKKINFSPKFIQSKRSANECITDIALDNSLCIYVANGEKLRYFSNSYSFSSNECFSDSKIYELKYTKQKDEERERARPGGDGKIKHIDLLSLIDNCCFSQHTVVAYEKGRIDCIDMSREYLIYSRESKESIKFKRPINTPQNNSPSRKKQNAVAKSIIENPIPYQKDFFDGIDCHQSKAVQLFCENKNDILTSFCALKKRCCLVSGKWNGGIEIIDMRANPAAGDGNFGLTGGDGFNFDSLVNLSASPVNDEILYAGFSSGLVAAIDLRVGLPVSESLTLPAFNIWPVAIPEKNKTSCIAVYDNESTIQFISQTNNEIVQTIYGNGFVGTTFNGGIVLADDFSASYFDLINDDDNLLFYDGAVSNFSPSETRKGKTLSFPYISINEVISCYDQSLDLISLNNPNSYISNNSGISNGQIGENDDDCDDIVELQVRKSVSSVHKHKSPVKCINKFGNLFVTGDSSGFVNLWTICSPKETRTIATYT